jgi:tetratricopeptide (TPR) repeat protein
VHERGREQQGPALRGRDAETGLLLRALDAAVTGRGSAVVISGEAGIGKSALAAALAREAEARQLEVVRGRAWEFADAPPYFPVLPCLKALGAEDAVDAANAFSTWERVLDALAHAARRAPVVWIVEDVHAADLLTLDLLLFLAQPVLALPALIVTTLRRADPRLDSRGASRVERLAREGIDLRLEPLGATDSEALARDWLGRELRPNEVKRVAALTAGNPLFIVELARAARAGGGHTLAESLPATVRQVVLDRVALLPDSTRRALVAGAILGREFSAGMVARLLEVLPARVVDDLLPALRAGLLLESQPGSYGFGHVLERDAIESMASAAERSGLHARAERALGAGGDGIEILVERARHALLGVQPGTEGAAFELGRRAAEMLEAHGAFDRAYGMYRQIETGRGLVPGGADAEPRDSLHVADVAWRAGRYADARRLCDGVIRAARAGSDAKLLADATLLMGADLRPGVVDGELVALLRESIAAVGDGDAELGCRLEARLAAALQPALDPLEPVEMAREAIRRARDTGDERLIADVLLVAGAACVDFAPLDERIEQARELLERALSLGDVEKALRARARLAMDLLERGDFAGFDRHVLELTAASVGLPHPRYRWRALLLGSMRALMHGDFGDSERHLVELDRLAALTDDPALQMSLSAHRMMRARHLHDDAALIEAAPRVVALLDGIPVANVIGALMRGAIFARLEDREATARELAVIEPRTELVDVDLSFRTMTTEAAIFAGSDEYRRHLRAILVPKEGTECSSGHVPVTYEGSTTRLIGLLDAALGDFAQAEPRLRRALEAAQRHELRPWVARLHYEIGTMLLAAGRADDAALELEYARASASELGMTGLVARARAAIPGAATRAAVAEPAQSAHFVLVKEGDNWRVELGPRAARVRDARGLQLLARLVERPGEELHVLVLSGDEAGVLAESDAGEHIDFEAERAYKRRLDELAALIDEADSNADLGRAARAREERAFIEAELSRALGLGGARRRAGSVTERARVNVQRRLKDAIGRIAEADPEIGVYLKSAVRTGTYCSFRP